MNHRIPMIYPPIYNDLPERQWMKEYFGKGIDLCGRMGYSSHAEPGTTDIYVIAFNSVWCVEWQIKTLKRFFQQKPFQIIIIDNNCGLHQEVSAQLIELCRKEEVMYLAPPDNLYQRPGHFDPSMKLGYTMNWVYQKCVLDRLPEYFGFLDQDCFLFQNFDKRDYLDEKGMYGQVSYKQETDKWNLHVTTNFYKTDWLKTNPDECVSEKYLPLDFRPSHKYLLDTGGMNYDVLCHRLHREDYEIPMHGEYYPGTDQWFTITDHSWIHLCGVTHDQLKGMSNFKEWFIKGWLTNELWKSK